METQKRSHKLTKSSRIKIYHLLLAVLPLALLTCQETLLICRDPNNGSASLCFYYVCNNGTPDPRLESLAPNTNRCISCNVNYTLENGVCRANSYVCANGTPSSLRDVAVDGLTRCISCDSGWYLRTAQQRCVNELLTNVDNVTDAGTLELNGAYSVTTATIGGTPYLFVAGYDDNGVSVFSIANDGTLTNVHNVTDAATLALNVAISVTTESIGGTPYLFVAGYDDDGLSVFSIANNGVLTSVYDVTDDTTLALNGAISVTTETIGGTSYLFVAGQLDDGLSVFSIANNGVLTSVYDVTDDASLELNGAASVTTATIGGTPYLFVAAQVDDGVSVFSIGTGGALTSVHDVTDVGSLELNGAASVTTESIGGTPYLFVAGRDDDGVSVFSIADDGVLTNVHNVDDAGSLELNGAISVTTESIGGTPYLFVAGRNDAGVSVFSIADDGILTNVHNVDDAGSLELDGATSITTATIGGTPYLFVAGRNDNGVSVFSINE